MCVFMGRDPQMVPLTFWTFLDKRGFNCHSFLACAQEPRARRRDRMVKVGALMQTAGCRLQECGGRMLHIKV